ncbi:helix-turn-helix domain-containing protein [Kutzneria sp. NPDC052558]|uniref:helix-turn-helix domain-containing protein n=1 Tax=Kutzneria sp. NPDC052558 TaxID=3364121 RepID=UPI0037C8CD20
MTSRSWEDVKREMDAIDRASGRDVAAAKAAAREKFEAFVIGHHLGMLRAKAKLTQVQVGERMGISQARVSQLERGDVNQLEVATVGRYVAAVGGRLRLVADFADHDVVITEPEMDESESCV